MNPADRETEKILEQIEKRISKEYRQAAAEVEDKLNDYLRRFAIKDQTWRRWVAEGKKTQAEYKQWKIGQIAMGKRWEALRDNLAHIYANADKAAKIIVYRHMLEVYAINHNWATYEVEHGLGVDTSYTLYVPQEIERILVDDPQMLPPPGAKVSREIAEGKAVRWNNQRIQSVMMQSILQGEAIPAIATRLAYAVADSDRKASVRNARTMTTGVQNAGRVDGYKRAERMGIELKQEWLATLDGRTRHTHRVLDGEVVEVGGTFSNGCRFPGDPEGLPREVYNCRCTLIAALKGYEIDVTNRALRHDEHIKDMSYGEWKRQRKSESNPILLPEEKASVIKWSYIKEYMTL